jgi:hypothetical protein
VTIDKEEEFVTLDRFGDILNWFGPLKIPQQGETTTILDKVTSQYSQFFTLFVLSMEL